jgi:hypothetical protein
MPELRQFHGMLLIHQEHLTTQEAPGLTRGFLFTLSAVKGFTERSEPKP